MRVVVSYDIADDHVRRRIAGLLQDLLSRVQYSVFEGAPPDDLLAAKVKTAVGLINPDTDSLRVYHLCGACAARVDVYGTAPRDESGIRVL